MVNLCSESFPKLALYLISFVCLIGARNKDELKAEKELILPGLSANTTYCIENVNLPMLSAESTLNTSKSNADTLDDKRDVTLAGDSKEVIIVSTSVLAKNSITDFANNGEESILESREDRGSSTVNGHSDTIQCVESTDTTQHITTTSNEIGVSIENVSGEIEKVNPEFLATPSSSESLVKIDNKKLASQETRKVRLIFV